MQTYCVRIETAEGGCHKGWHEFAGDDDAISYFLPLARGRLVEISRKDKMIACIDERPAFAALELEQLCANC